MPYRSKFGDDTIVSLRVVNPVFYRSTFLWPLNNLRNSIFDSVFNLNIWGDKQYNIGSRLNQNSGLTLNHNFVVKNNKTDKKQCYSIPRTEILLILRCQHVTRQIISNFQIWHSPNRQLSSHYRDQCWARKFNTAVMWALMTTSLPMDAYISNVWNHDLPVA